MPRESYSLSNAPLGERKMNEGISSFSSPYLSLFSSSLCITGRRNYRLVVGGEIVAKKGWMEKKEIHRVHVLPEKKKRKMRVNESKRRR